MTKKLVPLKPSIDFNGLTPQGLVLQAKEDRPIDLVTDGSLSERKARIILPTVRYATINP